MLTENHSWALLKSYFKSHSLVDHQIASYNEFIASGIQDIIQQNGRICVPMQGPPKYILRFGQVCMDWPTYVADHKVHPLYPLQARHQDLNYDSPILVDLHEIYNGENGTEEKVYHRVCIGRMPVMLRSMLCHTRHWTESEAKEHGECPYDFGGYFIIKGKERVLTAQMRAAYNRVMVFKQKPGEKYKWGAETRSMSSETGHSVLIKAMIGNDDREIVFFLPYVTEGIPVAIVLRALGLKTEEEIKAAIAWAGWADFSAAVRYMRFILRDALICPTMEDALMYIGKRATHTIQAGREIQYAKQVVENELLPHLGITGTQREQAVFLGRMVRKLIQTAIGYRGEDDRDNYSNKRAETAGMLLFDLFRNLFKKYVQFLQGDLEKRRQRPDVVGIISKMQGITKGLHRCLSTGNWGAQKNASYIRDGVSQILDRMTYYATVSHLRRVVIPMGKESKNAAMRQIHGSSFFFVCPAETPEGHKVGTVLNLSLLASLSQRMPIVEIKMALQTCSLITPIEKMDPTIYPDETPILLNGAIIGFTQKPTEVVEYLRYIRRQGELPVQLSISYDKRENDLHIASDDGRFVRPLLTMADNKVLIRPEHFAGNGIPDWNLLVRLGLVQYLDPAELETVVVSMSPNSNTKSDYCEIHPSAMFGIIASLIPYADHNQSPRNCYQSAMGKQALVKTLSTHRQRADPLLHIMHHSHKPLVMTKGAELLKNDEMPSGVNVVVAILCFEGYGIEDGYILNKTSVQRGLFRLTTTHTVEACEKKRSAYCVEKIQMPPLNTENLKDGQPGYFRRKVANYSLLDETGVVKVGSTVKKGDVVIGRVVITSHKNGEEYMSDASIVIQPGEEGIVDRVFDSKTPRENRMIKIVIRNIRDPIYGDKIASRSGQKGTIGGMFAQEDMPFTASGIVPDVIMNPHAYPGRMTAAQLIEMLAAKKACQDGITANATAFSEQSQNVGEKLMAEIKAELPKYGFKPNGREILYDGMTGQPMQAEIYMGPCYYQRLKHMVQDKMHARARRGPNNGLTRQPCEGRSRDGGLRFGEMERDCGIAHGMADFLRDRLFRASDPFRVMVCKSCGIMTATMETCHMCQGDDLVLCNLPYASKLIYQELLALGLDLRIRPETK
jgi:DNA-directed RNA polymerase II subunit RPB2